MVGIALPEQINAAVLLYNFEYDGREKEITAKTIHLNLLVQFPMFKWNLKG